MIDENPPIYPSKSLVERVKSILLTPKDEWPVIEAETTSTADIVKNHVLILAAIGPIALFIGGQLFGYSVLGIHYKPPFFSGLGMAVSSYVFSLIGLFISAFLINTLAPTFRATPDKQMAFKVAAYSSTAAWVAGIFQLIPSLGWLGILGLYSFYLLYLGLPRLMKAPADKAMSYTIVTIVAAIILYAIMGVIGGTVSGVFDRSATIASENSGGDGELSGSMTVPGVGKVDIDALQKAADDMKAGQNAKPVDKDALKALLPESIAGFSRTSIEANSATAGGFGGSSASARYAQGDKNFELSVTDLAGAGAFAGMAAAFNVEIDRETEDGYEKVYKDNNQMVQESWRKAESSGEYSRLIGKRFLVKADGQADSMDALKAAAAIPLADLEALAE